MKHEELDNDDLPVGRILSRREVLALFGSMGAGLLIGCAPRPSTNAITPNTGANPTTKVTLLPPTLAPATATSPTLAPTDAPSPTLAAVVPTSLPTCVVAPDLTEGPFFVDEKLDRADIRLDPSNNTMSDGAILELTFRVSQVGNACTVLSGALVDIWHCDAAGRYSDVRQNGTSGQQFLRGYQTTDANGMVKFTTIYPGWYNGRAVHIHFKIRSAAGAGTSYEFTSQLFFDEAISDAVFAQAPYNAQGTRTTRMSNDGVFNSGDSNNLILAPTKTATGYAAMFDVGFKI